MVAVPEATDFVVVGFGVDFCYESVAILIPALVVDTFVTALGLLIVAAGTAPSCFLRGGISSDRVRCLLALTSALWPDTNDTKIFEMQTKSR